MPPAKRQPNLLVGAVRYLLGTPPSGGAFLDALQGHRDAVAGVMSSHSTQTNEPGRCATLLPALAALPQPLALLEVGASAGLCLLPDHYGYAYGATRVGPTAHAGVDPPVLPCRASLGTPLPRAGVEVSWRAGLDLDPVDVEDDERWRWLEALVWPGNEDRVVRLRAAREVRRHARPRLVRGDLRRDLRALAADAPSDATLVVFHTAVLMYVPEPDEREAFAREVAELGAVWIANESPRDIPGAPAWTLEDSLARTRFLLSVDRRPTAWTHSWGASIDWLGGASL